MVLLGKKIKELRNKHKYTQTELANRLGVTRATIAAYENDSRQPSYEVLVKLTRIFKVSLDYLVLNKQMETVCVDGLSENEIGAVQALITYFRRGRLIDDFYDDKPLDKKDKRTLIDEYYSKDNNDIIDDLTKKIEWSLTVYIVVENI